MEKLGRVNYYNKSLGFVDVRSIDEISAILEKITLEDYIK